MICFGFGVCVLDVFFGWVLLDHLYFRERFGSTPKAKGFSSLVLLSMTAIPDSGLVMESLAGEKKEETNSSLDMVAATSGNEALEKFMAENAATMSQENSGAAAETQPVPEQAAEEPTKTDHEQVVEIATNPVHEQVAEEPTKPGHQQVVEIATNSVHEQAVEGLMVMDPTELKPVPDAIWEQVNQTMLQPTCRKCGQPCDLQRLVNKGKGKPRNNVVCRGCNSATTMLSRHLGSWPVPAFQGLSQDQQIAFWKNCNAIIMKQGKLDYGSIRAALCIQLEEKQTEIAKAEFNSEYLPLSVWVQRGFNADDVKKGLCEIHPQLGETYAIALKSVSKGYIKEKVETMISSFEGLARKRKAAQLEVTGNKVPKSIDDSKDMDLVGLTWLPTNSPSKKQSEAGEHEQEEQDAEELTAKEIRQQAAALKRHNQSVAKLAQKGFDALSPLVTKQMKLEANKRLMPMQTLDELDSVGREIANFMEKCQAGLKPPNDGERLDDLPFDAKSLATKVKEIKAVFTGCEKMLKILNKAKGKAS